MAIRKVSRYEVIRELGRGGMATVFYARDPNFKRDVAVKLLPREFLHNPGFRARFEREAQTIAALEHPSIVTVYDFGEDGSRPFLVMRFMAGGSLADRIRRGPLSLAQTATIVEQLGSALDYAHSKGIIHRDLKPANILFDQFGKPYLGDFGIARLSQSTNVLTATGSIIGTPEYMSPEQVQGDMELDGRSDIYALGIIMYEMLTGQQPFRADTPAKVMMKHVLESVPNIRVARPDLPPGSETIIARAVAKDRNRRYQSAAQIVADLKRLVSGKAVSLAAASATVQDSVTPGGAYQKRTVQEGAIVEASIGQSKVSSPQPSAPIPATSPAETRSGWRKSLGQWWFLVVGIVLFLVIICFTSVALLVGNQLIGSPTAESENNPIAVIINTPASDSSSESVADNNDQTAVANRDVPTTVPPVGSDNIYIEYILDASGSMLERLQGQTKLAIGQEVLSKRLAALPPDVHVGLRVYGHRVPFEDEEESCADIELITPVDVGNAQPIIDWLPSMQAQGMTPMSESVRQAAEDFTFEPGRQNTIILISDGAETCGDEPAEVAAFLQELGIDFTIHVIGLNVDNEARGQLKRLAQVANGVYHDANSAEDLESALGTVDELVISEAVARASQEESTTSVPELTEIAPPAETVVVPTLAASPTPVLTQQSSPTAVPQPTEALTPINITSEGSAQVSSTYSGFPPSLSLDGNLSTSWFSAGSVVDGSTSFYRWDGARDDLITTVTVRSNASHSEPSFRTGFGFESVTVQVLDSAGAIAFEQTIGLPGTPDPDVTVQPNVVGRSVLLIFNGHESPDCGGFSELQITAGR